MNAGRRRRMGSRADLPAGPSICDAADLNVAIPMAGNASSLNISVAVSLLLFELKRIDAF